MPPKPSNTDNLSKDETPEQDGTVPLNSDDSLSREPIDPHNVEKWKEIGESTIRESWIEPMKYVLVTLQYLNDCLKDKEATVGWWLILITSFTSFLTLFTPKELGTGAEFNQNYDWSKGVLLSVLSFTATLLASWAKKKGFVKRIKDLDKRIYAIETKRSVVSSVLTLPIEDRPQYIYFYKEHIAEVQDLLCYNQLISPTEMNEVLYNLTKNYPTLIKNIQPWYKKITDDKYEPDFEYGYNIIKSFEKRKLNGLWYRLTSLFYCKSRCCYDIDDGNPFTNKLMMAQIDRQKKDDASTATLMRKNKHHPSNKEPITANNLMSILAEANDGPGMNDSTSFNMLSELIDKKSAKQIDAIKSKVSSQVNNEINTRLSKALSIKTDADKKIKDQKQKLNDKVNNLVEQGENITTTISEIEKNVAKQSNETIVNINEALESDSAESSPKSQTSNDNKV
jgi:hypothetical protein